VRCSGAVVRIAAPPYEGDEDPNPPEDPALTLPPVEAVVPPLLELLLLLPTTLAPLALEPPPPAFELAPPPPFPPPPPPPGPAFWARAGPAVSASPATNIAARSVKAFMRPPTDRLCNKNATNTRNKSKGVSRHDRSDCLQNRPPPSFMTGSRPDARSGPEALAPP